MYGQMSNTNEPSSTPELSPVRGNDGSGEGTGSLATRILDEVDDEDPFSKRRYKISNVLCCLCCLYYSFYAHAGMFTPMNSHSCKEKVYFP